MSLVIVTSISIELFAYRGPHTCVVQWFPLVVNVYFNYNFCLIVSSKNSKKIEVVSFAMFVLVASTTPCATVAAV